MIAGTALAGLGYAVGSLDARAHRVPLPPTSESLAHGHYTPGQ
jgi:hypothetical protein